MTRAWQVLVRMRTHSGKTVVRSRVDCNAIDPALACISAYAVAKHESIRVAKSTETKLPKIAVISFLVRPAASSADKET